MRCLVATVVALSNKSSLLAAVTSGRKELTAIEAPAEGLCFVDAGGQEELSYGWRWGGETLVGVELDGRASYEMDQRSQQHVWMEGVSRYHARLGWRLADAGLPDTPKNRALAFSRLCNATQMRSAKTEEEVREKMKSTTTGEEWDMMSPSSMGEVVGGDVLEDKRMDLPTMLECPPWAWPRLQSALGRAVEAELRALQAHPPLDLRVNTLLTSRKEALRQIRAVGINAEPTPYSPLGIRLEGGLGLGRVPGVEEGRVEPQDEGAQLACLLVGAQPGERVVDFCGV